MLELLIYESMRGLWAISGLKVKLRGHSSYVLIGALRGVGGEGGRGP